MSDQAVLVALMQLDTPRVNINSCSLNVNNFGEAAPATVAGSHAPVAFPQFPASLFS